MTILWLPVIELAVGLPIALAIRASRKKAAPVAVAPVAAPVEVGTEIAVEIALKSAWRSLQGQRVGGYGPWLSCCIERINRGQEVPAAVAVTALRKTLSEIEPYAVREGYDKAHRVVCLDALYSAIRELEQGE